MHAAIQGLSAAVAERPTAPGKWSTREMILHLAFWDREVLGTLEDAYAHGRGMGLSKEDILRMNPIGVDELHHHDWESAKRLLQSSRERLLEGSFYALMLSFVWQTLDKSLTQLALLLCALIILSPGDPRAAILAFIAGAGLGYFLEVWGTTRECWTYYSLQTPPLFAVLAHGMAAVAFWRVGLVFHWLEGVIYRSKRSVVDYG